MVFACCPFKFPFLIPLIFNFPPIFFLLLTVVDAVFVNIALSFADTHHHHYHYHHYPSVLPLSLKSSLLSSYSLENHDDNHLNHHRNYFLVLLLLHYKFLTPFPLDTQTHTYLSSPFFFFHDVKSKLLKFEQYTRHTASCPTIIIQLLFYPPKMLQ